MWPLWLHEQWTNPTYYNFWSSEWGGIAVKLVGLAIFSLFVQWGWKKVHHHLECEVPECPKIGHPVHGTSHRACKEHHPHLDETGHTVEEIHAAAACAKIPSGSDPPS